MSISASEKEDWVETEHYCPVSEGPPDLQEELVRVLTTAIQELELTWSPLEKPAKSKLDSWYFRLTRQQADSRVSKAASHC